MPFTSKKALFTPLIFLCDNTLLNYIQIEMYGADSSYKCPLTKSRESTVKPGNGYNLRAVPDDGFLPEQGNNFP